MTLTFVFTYSHLQELDLNIVFDLGGVVFNWQPDAMIINLFEDTRAQGLVRKEIFEHADWVDLDRGAVALDKAVCRRARGLVCPVMTSKVFCTQFHVFLRRRSRRRLN